MGDPVMSPDYWRRRIRQCGGDLQRAMFDGSAEQFGRKHQEHMNAVQAGVRASDSVLDAGCGYGRLLNLLPCWWQGTYLGVDCSPEFVRIARVLYPDREFLVADLRELPFADQSWDVAVCVWLQTMITRELGGAAWEPVEQELRRVARRLLIVS